ncbi:hypothetical protein [Paraburkholderia sp.]|uniref:hypothetical protein n=1 Tax=Paraburkholderia sp. TaxID=1926495 RepID=UPI00260137DF|nr:hypothetical protein [Paraburkholderia sp.]
MQASFFIANIVGIFVGIFCRMIFAGNKRKAAVPQGQRPFLRRAEKYSSAATRARPVDVSLCRGLSGSRPRRHLRIHDACFVAKF